MKKIIKKIKKVIKKVEKVEVKKVEVKKVEKKIEMPVFEGDKVLKILSYGETDKYFHCSLEGGITKHVPKYLFI